MSEYQRKVIEYNFLREFAKIKALWSYVVETCSLRFQIEISLKMYCNKLQTLCILHCKETIAAKTGYIESNVSIEV